MEPQPSPSSEPTTLLVRDARFRDHAASGHPERPERLDAIDAALDPLPEACAIAAARAASDDEILRVHGRDHLERIASTRGRHTQLDPDTYTAPASADVARLAAGAAIDAARSVARGGARNAFALVRPPGHHAEPSRAMGFCLLNNAALAARALQTDEGLERIAIVDWDVHHGNGTQQAFVAERDVLFVSLHQFPLYPGTGALAERGSAAGEGSSVNLPLPAGCGDAEYARVFDAVVLPVLREFQPQLILVSAGFDAHERDPLAGMRVTTQGFRQLAARMRQAAESLCGGRLVLTLEGGYDLAALGASVRGVVEVLSASEAPVAPDPVRGGEIEALVGAFRQVHSRTWRALTARVRA